MDNQNDPSAQFDQIISTVLVYIDYGFHISNIVGLLSTIVLILTYGSSTAFSNSRYFFTNAATTVHLIRILQYMLDITPDHKKEDEHSVILHQSITTILKKLFLCNHFHHLCILFLFTYSHITPIVFIFSYLFDYTMNFINYTIKELFPNIANSNIQSAESTENVEESQSNKQSTMLFLKQLSSSNRIQYVPLIFQITILIQTLLITIFEMKLSNLLVFFIYIFWNVMFEYATNPIYNKFWTDLALKINNLAQANMSSYGSVISVIMAIFSNIGQFALAFYK